jgi:hypothetical protein
MNRIASVTDDNSRSGGILDNLAMALLVATLIGRIVVPELPFRTSPFMGIDSGDGIILAPNHIDLASMTFSAMIGLAGVLWLVAQGLGKRLEIRAGWLAILIAMFAAWSLGSAFQTGDRRGALVFWTNQVGLMFAGWLSIQLCATPRRRAMLLAVLAAAGVMLAVVGLRQVFIDAPERIADFEERCTDIFAARRWTPDSPQAIAFEERLSKAVPLGFFSLANIFASSMIVLAAATIGLIADRWPSVLRDRSGSAGSRKKGEIHLPTLSAILLSVTGIVSVAAFVLALSRAALGAALCAAVAGGIVLKFRDRLAVRWRRWMLAMLLAIGLGAGAVIAHGLKHDSLVAKTMTFRWYYWTAGAEITAESPVWGVGPGGFASAYEAARRPAAEESVKSPHNFVVHAAVQYGLPGALLYLGILAIVIYALCRPVDNWPARLDPGLPAGRPIAAIVLLPLVAIASQCVFGGARGAGGAMLINAAEPAVILAIGLAIAVWWGPQFSHAAAEGRRVTRVVLTCGLAGFLAHNSVTFSIWTPGAAILFWLGAGAVISMGRPAARDLKQFRWLAVGGSVAALVAIIALLWLPVARRSWATEMAVDGLIAGDGDAALAWAERAANCDTLDPIAAVDIASLMHRSGRPEDLAAGYPWAKEAIRRNPLASSSHRLAADILWDSGSRGADWRKHMTDAIRRDPQSIRMRIRFAERLVTTEMGKLAGEQLRAAEATNAALADDSIFRLSEARLARVGALKARAAELERAGE